MKIMKVAFVAFVSVFGYVATSSSAAGYLATSCAGMLSKFFIRNNLLLKVLKTFSLALRNITQNLFFKCFCSLFKIL